MQRVNASATFTDLPVARPGGPSATAFFDKLLAVVPFDRLAASVAGVFRAGDAADAAGASGRPHDSTELVEVWPVATMVKVLFLQKCFGLSDPLAEEMLRDRIRFRRFVGLSFDGATPDHTTTGVFRRRLREAGHGSTLFDEALAVLRERGLVLENGTLTLRLRSGPRRSSRPRSTASGTTARARPTRARATRSPSTLLRVRS